MVVVHKNHIILIQIIIIVLLIIFAYFYWSLNIAAEVLIYPLSIFFSILFIWSLWSWEKIEESLFNPYILFFISAALFNGGQIFLEVFHLNDQGMLQNLFSPEIILKSVFLVTLGLSVFHLGALISMIQSKKKLQNKIALQKIVIMDQDIRLIGFILIVISIIPTIFFLKESFPISISFGYSALYEEEIPTGLNALPRTLSHFFIPGILFLLAGGAKKKSIIGLTIILMFSYGLANFLLGYRSKAVTALLVYFWLWHKVIQPLPATFLFISSSIGLFVVLPLIKAIRSYIGAERLQLNFLIASYFSIDNPFIAIITEFGDSMRAIAYTLQLVPTNIGFQWGSGYLYSLFAIIPNLFWRLHPSIARETAAYWLVNTVAPNIAEHGGGLGYSFIAEAYFNFSWIGAPIILGLISYLFMKFVFWGTKDKNSSKLAIVASFLSFFLFYARSDSTIMIRALIWYSLFPYSMVYLIALLRQKSSSKNNI